MLQKKFDCFWIKTFCLAPHKVRGMLALFLQTILDMDMVQIAGYLGAGNMEAGAGRQGALRQRVKGNGEGGRGHRGYAGGTGGREKLGQGQEGIGHEGWGTVGHGGRGAGGGQGGRVA